MGPTTKVFSLAGFAVAILAFGVSDVVNQGYDPMDETISRYVNQPYGWLVTIGMLAISAGSAARAIRTSGSGWGGWLLWLWAGCVLVAAVLPADPPGNWDHPSFSDSVHGAAAPA